MYHTYMHTPIDKTGVCRINQHGATVRDLHVTQENVLEIFYDFLKFGFDINFSTIKDWEEATGINLTFWEKEQMLSMNLTLSKQKNLSVNPSCIDPLLTKEEKQLTLNTNFVDFLKGAQING